MSLAIIAKVGGSLLLGSGVVATGVVIYLYNPSIIALNADDSKNIFIYVISEAVNDVLNNEIDNTDTARNYNCKFDNKEYKCKISEPNDFDETNKHISIEDLKTDKTTQTNINKNQLKTANNIYKIKINGSINDWTNNDHKMEIIPKDPNNENKDKKYASLKPLFALGVSNNVIDQYTKTNYVLVKTNSPVTVTTTSEEPHTYKCLTSEDPINSSNINDECIISDFSDSSDSKPWNELTFKKPTNANVNMVANKYYLVKLKNPIETNKIKHIKIQKGSSLISLDSKIIPVIYNDKKPDNLFILGEPTKMPDTEKLATSEPTAPVVSTTPTTNTPPETTPTATSEVALVPVEGSTSTASTGTGART